MRAGMKGRLTVSKEEAVQGVCQNVQGRRVSLSSPMKRLELLQNQFRISEGGNVCRGK